MKTLVIVAHGDNVDLHRKALAAAVQAVESVNNAPIYRAYIEEEADRSRAAVAEPVADPLADWTVELRRNPIIGVWHWYATGPGGATLPGMMAITKEHAEADALRRIRMHLESETVSAATLAERLNA